MAESLVAGTAFAAFIVPSFDWGGLWIAGGPKGMLDSESDLVWIGSSKFDGDQREKTMTCPWKEASCVL